MADSDQFAATVRLPQTEIYAPQGRRVCRPQATFRVTLDRGGTIRFPRPHRVQNSAIRTLPFSIARSVERYLYCRSSWLIPFLSSASVIVGAPIRCAVFAITKQTSVSSISCVVVSRALVVDYRAPQPQNRATRPLMAKLGASCRQLRPGRPRSGIKLTPS